VSGLDPMQAPRRQRTAVKRGRMTLQLVGRGHSRRGPSVPPTA
jgi:hypothetical protein